MLTQSERGPSVSQNTPGDPAVDLANKKSFPLQRGDRVNDRYVVDAVIGSGGYGVVFRALQESTGQSVALKVLRGEGSSIEQDERRRARFMREMKLTGRLNHPNIVRLIDFGVLQTGELFIVMEYVDGVSLSRLLNDEGGLRPSEAKHFMTQLLLALSAAHELGIVYRDLKPANVMITTSGHRRNAILLDFGISAVLEEHRDESYMELTSAGQVHGTPAYMAPEQLRAEPPTPKSDIYAWGLVFIECLTGKRVVVRDSYVETLAAQISDEPVEIPMELKKSPCGNLLRKAVAKELLMRYDNVGELIEELDVCEVPASLVLPWTGKKAKDEIKRSLLHLTQSPSTTSWSGEQGAMMATLDGLGDNASTRSLKPSQAAGSARPDQADSQRNNVLLYVGVAVALVALIGFIALLVGGGEAPKAPAAPPDEEVAAQAAAPAPAPLPVQTPESQPKPESFLVSVSVKPANASLFVDDELVATGNLALRMVADGKSHSLLARAEGYEDYRVNFVDVAPPSSIELVALSEPVDEPVAEVEPLDTGKADGTAEKKAKKHRDKAVAASTGEKPVTEKAVEVETAEPHKDTSNVPPKDTGKKKDGDWGDLGTIDTPNPWD